MLKPVTAEEVKKIGPIDLTGVSIVEKPVNEHATFKTVKKQEGKDEKPAGAL